MPELVDRALGRGLEVEVFSNLVRVTPALWELFERPGVRLATSYYSDAACEHERITTRRGSHRGTRVNIAEAVRRSIPLRVGVIDMGDGQRCEQAVVELRALGVTQIDVDRLRQVGRGVRDAKPAVDQLCGHCADGVLAVSPSGDVWPCVFSRWLPVGNVRFASLAEIAQGEHVERVRGDLTRAFASDPSACPPRCDPHCHPTCPPRCGPSCNPCTPSRRCWPHYPPGG